MPVMRQATTTRNPGICIQHGMQERQHIVTGCDANARYSIWDSLEINDRDKST